MHMNMNVSNIFEYRKLGNMQKVGCRRGKEKRDKEHKEIQNSNKFNTSGCIRSQGHL